VAAPVVEIVDIVTPELLAGVRRLVPQLSASAPVLDEDDLGEIVACPVTVFFVARVDGVIAGCLTLVLFRLPTGKRAWIEDVVVDQAARGQGVGEAMSRVAVEAAQSYGARTVDLTSRPSREAANRLYQRLGFVARDTNVYRYAG
jgi:ribosomal protein S18 acetylase RimI-like enzyme